MKQDNDPWVREMFRKEEQLKRMLSKMIDNHEKMMKEHQQWLKQHDVRLTEHWRHIAKTKK